MREIDFSDTEASLGITVTTPYAEGSILAIARAACRRGLLDRLLTTLYWADETRWGPLQRLLDQRTIKGIPKRHVAHVARPTEVGHILVARTGARHAAVHMMYQTKERFDHAAAQAIVNDGSRTVIAMYAAAEKTFESARSDGACTVLHFVNSHPRVHNALLEEAGAPVQSAEYIPELVAQRVSAELQLADLVLVPSSFVAAQLVREGVPPNRLATIPYGVDPAFFAPSPRRGRRSGPLKCVFVGQISWRKGRPRIAGRGISAR